MEAGIGSSFFHSIVAMPQYRNFSFEELRMEDYNASGGIFGSKFAKLGAALCDRTAERLRPHCFGTLFIDALKSFKDQNQGQDQDKHQGQHHDQHHSESETDSKPDVPVEVFKGKNHIRNVNMSFQGIHNVTVHISSDSADNFSFTVAQKSLESKSNYLSKSDDFSSIVENSKAKVEPSEKMKSVADKKKN